MPLETLQNSRYRILRTLGSGSMGEVYLVDDTRINRQVAIKVIRTEATPYPADSTAAIDAARLFEREAKTIARLNHPNILPLYDFGEEVVNGSPLTYMVMPYSPEGSLAAWQQQRTATQPLTTQDVAHFLRQAADALQYAHDNELIHQDVKPQNFLIRTNKNARLPDLLLADFGIAKLTAGTSGASQAIRGTPIYMAPEQWEGHPVPASDQYALAVMIYQLLAGQPPFQGGPGQMMYQHFNVSPQPPGTFNPAVSPDLDAVILRAMAKNPADRFPSVSAFADAFQQALTIEAPTVASAQDKSGEVSIRATLAISPEEAHQGSSRTLTLAGGQRVKIAIPPGTQTGQVIRATVQDTSSADTSATLPLLLTIAIAHTGENLPTVLTSEEKTYATGLPTIGPGSSKVTLSNMATSSPGSSNADLSDHPTILSSNPSTPVFPPQYDAPVSNIEPMAAPPGNRRPRRGMTILLTVLALLLVLGSAGAIFYYFASANTSTSNANATATANAQANANANATAQANGTTQANSNTATAQANATGTSTQSKGNANATATANAQANANATATAITQGNINANATATAQASASVVPFSVQSVNVTVNPTSIAGDACGTTITVTYTATFTVSANSPGGTVQFMYTTDGGHSNQSDKLTFTAGQTTKTYTFTWTGALPADHTAPGVGEVTTSSPNSVTSNGAQPSGQCVSVTPSPT